MPLGSGDRLGPYEILAPIGAGNMGEIYRARDVRLGRDVAIKVLLPTLAADAESVERFAREARAVAALSHPNIVALHDVGQEGATTYVVTELLQGDTLRDRLRGGPLPMRKAVDFARQTAEAIAAAHDRGIVHRDLKPENIFVTADGRVKVLDFGVAQMTTPAAMPDAVTVAATLDGDRAGVFGSVGYMSPEQLRGAVVDHRADIFALGCVLYELLTGRRPFAAATPADSIAAVLHGEPPPLGLPRSPAGAQLERVIGRCLEKTPEERFQSSRDLAFALTAMTDEGRGEPAATRRSSRLIVLSTLAVAAAVVASIVALWPKREAPPPVRREPVRFGIAATTTWSDAASISPDGRYVVYTGGIVRAPGAQSTAPSGRFWLRRLDSLDAVPLSQTQEAVPLFFWSPDSRFLGYQSGNAVVIRQVPDGQAQVIAELPSAPIGVAWGPRGDLLIAAAEGIYRMASSTERPVMLMRTDPAREIWRGSPSFLPDGERFLFNVLASGAGEHTLETRVASVDGRELATIGKGMVGTSYSDGMIIFGASGGLFAQRFDVERLALIGDRSELATSVAQDWRTGRLSARASNTGILVLRGAVPNHSQFTIMDRRGRPLRTIGTPDSYTNFSLSPDEQRIIATRQDPLTGRGSLWLIDVARGVTSLASDPNDTHAVDDPTWAPDGRHIAFRYGAGLVLRLANGGDVRAILDAEAYPDSFTRDGRFLIYGQPRGNGFQQFAIDITARGAQAIPLVTGVTLADEGRVSPNGRWVAYHSNETGTAQVYVMPFPPTGEKWQISPKGGVQPRWSQDGNELFYLDADGRMMAVKTASSDARQAAAPEMLFAAGFVPSDALDQYTPVRDGFLVRAPVSAGTDSAAVHVIVNWKP